MKQVEDIIDFVEKELEEEMEGEMEEKMEI